MTEGYASILFIEINYLYNQHKVNQHLNSSHFTSSKVFSQQ